MKKVVYLFCVVSFSMITLGVDSDFDGLEDWDETNIYATDPTKPDTDEDGLLDGVEVNIYRTNPLRESTDGDLYDDGQEINGWSPADLGAMGGDMPGYVLQPGDNVFVAAYPVIDIDIDETISVIDIAEITTHYGTINIQTIGYSVGNIEGSSLAAGATSGHTHEEWRDVTNIEEDYIRQSLYEDSLTSSNEQYTRGWEEGKTFEREFGSNLSVNIGDTGVYGKIKEGVSYGESGSNYKGMSAEVQQGVGLVMEKVRKTIVTEHNKDEYSFSTTVTRTGYQETIVTNTNSIATGEEWATATTIDPSNAGKLRFTFFITNTGTDVARDIQDLRFNVFIGDNIPITYPKISDPAISLSNLFPGDNIQFSGEIVITLDELSDIDQGKPIRFRIADFSYGADELAYNDAWNRDVIVEIDDGVADGDETIDYYMTYIDYGEYYIDALKRLNQHIPVRSPSNLRKEIDITMDDDFITEFSGNPISKWSSLQIYLQEHDPNIRYFQDQPAVKKTRLLMVYNQDTDHDFYTDRAEWKIGTDKNDPTSHPSPILIVGKLEEQNGSNRKIKLKFQNAGNYDAYGIEAKLYSPDSTTTIIDSFYGGAGRIEAGRVFEPNDSLAFTVNQTPYTEPVVLITYNDPVGHHSFLTKLSLSGPDDDISEDADEMIYGIDFNVETNNEHTYNQDNWIIINYHNPDIAIENANLNVAYQDPNGNLIHVDNQTVNIESGENSFIFEWKPSEYLPETIIGEPYKALVLIKDYQNIELFDDVLRFNIVPYPGLRLVDRFSDNSTQKDLNFNGNESYSIYLKVPIDANVVDASMFIRGKYNHFLRPSDYPHSPWMQVGGIDSVKEWSLEGCTYYWETALLNTLSGQQSPSVIYTDRLGGERTLNAIIPKHANVLQAGLSITGSKNLWIPTSHYRSLLPDNISASGIATEDDYIWVLNSNDRKVHVYNQNFDLITIWNLYSENLDPVGIENTPGYLWVGDNQDGVVYRYTKSGNYTNFNISLGESYPGIKGLSSSCFHGGFLYVLLSSGQIKEYNTYNKTLKSTIDISNITDNFREGITAYVTGYNQQEKKRIYVGSGIPTRAIEIDASLFSQNYGTIVLDNSHVVDSWGISFFPADVVGCNIETLNNPSMAYNRFLAVDANNDQMKLFVNDYPPTSPYMDVGVQDYDYEWEFLGVYDETQTTADFSQEIISYLDNCTTDAQGNAVVPLYFHSDSEGKLKIHDVDIRFNRVSKTLDISTSINNALNNGLCDCDGCIIENGCCLIPLIFHSDSKGILSISSLRLIYEPTDYDKVNIDGINPVNVKDYSLLASDFLKTDSYLIGDIDRNQTCDINDLIILAEYWLRSCNCN